MILLVVTGLFLLNPRLFPGWRASAMAAIVFLAVAGSYAALKAVKETNLSNQLKYTMGVPDTNPIEPLEYKGLSTFEAVRRAYAKISWQDAFENKIHNLSRIFQYSCFLGCEPGFQVKRHLWGHELMPVLGSLKLFNIAWPLFLLSIIALLPIAELRRFIFTIQTEQIQRAANIAVAVAAAGLLIYGIMSFRQGVTNILSAGFMLLLFGATAARLFALPGRLNWILVAACFLYLTTLAARMTIEDRLVVNWPLFILLIVIVVVLAVWIFQIVRRQN
jgi:hypothetical protein